MTRFPGRRAFVARLFHLLYHQFAWSYDAVSAVVSLGQWRAWGEAAVPFLTGPRVLELGHGPGHLQATLLDVGWRPVGIDLSPQMGQLARRRLGRRGSGAALVRGRAEMLPFGDGAFDCVVATFPAPYIVAPDTVAAVGRVLVPGGRLIIVPEAQLTGSGPLTATIEWLYRITGQRSATPDNDQNREFWTRVLGAGFAVSVYVLPRAKSYVTVVIAERAGKNP